MNGECEIISVGTELLTGAILNTNSRFLAEKLSSLGFSVHRQTAVGDNAERLKKAFSQALEDNDLVIVTGGLGPTQDDLTKETAAAYFGRELILVPELETHLRDWFKRRGLQMTPNNLRQAYIPEGARILHNSDGSAPGVLLEENGKIVILLPGPPHEMRTVFNEQVLPVLDQYCSACVTSRYYGLTGIGESKVEDTLMDLIDAQSNPTLATYAKPDEVLLRVTASGTDIPENEKLLDEKEAVILERLGGAVFTHSKQSLSETIAGFLIKNDCTIAAAESCTGGLISSELTQVAGISTCFMLGVVSYSNQAKKNVLGVQDETLERYGAVSAQTCTEMCEGVRRLAGTDIGVATTGIAGPGGGSVEKPVGLVYTGVATKNGTVIRENHFTGSRTHIQKRAANAVYQMIREICIKDK